MSETDLEELERQLLGDPFNETLRATYGARLLEAYRIDDAEQQFELLRKSNSDSTAATLGLARCALRRGDDREAVDLYISIQGAEDFKPDEELQSLLADAQTSTPRFGVVEGGATVTDIRTPEAEVIRFTHIAGMDKLKKTLRLQIIEPFRNPGLFQRFRKKAGGGVLLYGPPGCGKTLMARAIAGECNAEFTPVGISDVLNMWIGESEANLAAIFEKARATSPSVLFFDELDALAYSRSKASSSAARTVVNEFLAQLDGFSADNNEVLVLAATNMPWDVDPAMKRPGRFSRQVFVPPPDKEARREMFVIKTRGVPVEDIDWSTLAERTEFFSGADIDGLIDLAKESVLAEILDGGEERNIEIRDFGDALEQMSPSTIDWLQTARNLVKFSGADDSYRDVGKYLKKVGKL